MDTFLNIVFIGDVDSGKSTLIGRLLYDTKSIPAQARSEFEDACRRLSKPLEFAFLLDSFKEEREEEFTLDTTQAALKWRRRRFLLIDTPGHCQLVKNMLSGASYADAAMLVLDAQRPMEEQARRLIYLLKFIGIKEVIVAVNKMDAVGYSQEHFLKVKAQVQAALSGNSLAESHVIPLSAREGYGLLKLSRKMPWYRGPSLFAALAAIEKAECKYDFRFPIQDIYEVKGERVALGAVASGWLRRGESLSLCGSERQFMVKEIKVFNRDVMAAYPSLSIGLILDDSGGLCRGQVLYKGRAPKISDLCEAKIFCVEALNIQDAFEINCATQKTCCRIMRVKECIDTAAAAETKPEHEIGQFFAARVEIRFDEPLAMESYADITMLGRFILKRQAQAAAIGVVC